MYETPKICSTNHENYCLSIVEQKTKDADTEMTERIYFPPESLNLLGFLLGLVFLLP